MGLILDKLRGELEKVVDTCPRILSGEIRASLEAVVALQRRSLRGQEIGEAQGQGILQESVALQRRDVLQESVVSQRRDVPRVSDDGACELGRALDVVYRATNLVRLAVSGIVRDVVAAEDGEGSRIGVGSEIGVSARIGIGLRGGLSSGIGVDSENFVGSGRAVDFGGDVGSGIAAKTPDGLFGRYLGGSLDDVEPLPGVDPILIKRLAIQLFKSSGAKESGKPIVINGSKSNLPLIKAVAEVCEEEGVDFYIDVTDGTGKVHFINDSDDDGLRELVRLREELYTGAVVIDIKNEGVADVPVDGKKMRRFNELASGLHAKVKSKEIPIVSTSIPTPVDAEEDGGPYDEYLRLFFEACDQPWEQISEAQEKLVDKFNKGRKVRIVNDEGTDIAFDISGQTFVNSTTSFNIPGSEFFSSPIRDSVNGKWVARGKFRHHTDPLVENIELEFENGRVVRFKAGSGEDTLRELVTDDDGQGGCAVGTGDGVGGASCVGDLSGEVGEASGVGNRGLVREVGKGMRYVGEIGFGTNPHLRRCYVNSSLVEKGGRTAHLALGGSWEYTEYEGKSVKVDNGNRSRSNIHWDITVMLGGNNGRIELDGEVVQQNGVWIGDGLEVLNKGWGALPSSLQPEWWKERYPDGYVD
jgi:aminopeptidase